MAPTGSLLFNTIVQVRAVSGVQFADQPPNLDPAAGVAVNVTVVPRTKLPVHPEPPTVLQLMTPSGVVTVPFPKPTR